MPVVRQREAARRDLVEHFVYLAENAGLHVADRSCVGTPDSPGL
jgi:toxin ParE1/3/4